MSTCFASKICRGMLLRASCNQNLCRFTSTHYHMSVVGTGHGVLGIPPCPQRNERKRSAYKLPYEVSQVSVKTGRKHQQLNSRRAKAAELEHPQVQNYGPSLRPEQLRRLSLSKEEQINALKAVDQFLKSRCQSESGLFNLSDQVSSVQKCAQLLVRKRSQHL